MVGRYPDHRVRTATNIQHWQWLTFLHWPMAPATVQRLLPPTLSVDTFEGRAWLTITPFRMRLFATPGVPLPLVPHFVEVNVRTYVRGRDGRDGVWFFSLECSRLAVTAALRLLGLPYQRSETAVRGSADRMDYYAQRRTGPGRFRAQVRIGAPIGAPDAFTNFLTGRWNAYSQAWGRTWRTPIDHEPWPLYRASARADACELLRANSLPPVTHQPVAHFSPLVHVRIGVPRPI